MLEESVEVMRGLFTRRVLRPSRTHYTVENARIYTVPAEPPPIYISGFGPKSTTLAGRIGDGYITTSPDKELIAQFCAPGGDGKPMQAGYKVCWGNDDDEASGSRTAAGANSGLPGELAQVLPSPKHFEQASGLGAVESTRESIAYGEDVERHVDAFRPYAEAGVDAVHISQIGGAARRDAPRVSSSSTESCCRACTN